MPIRERDLPRDVLRTILERSEPAKVSKEPKAVEFVTAGVAIVGGKLVINVAVETKNETNQRQWKAKNRRAGMAWRAVREAVGVNLALLGPYCEHVHKGGGIRATFVRIGQRRLDASNVFAATKGVEDAVCYLLGVDDGSSAWHPIPTQELGGAIGVRIEIEAI